MFCKSCGKKIDDDSVFCSFCGTKQSEYVRQSNSEKEEIIERAKSNNNEYSSLNEPKYDPSYLKEKEETLGGVVLLIIQLFLAIIKPFKFDNPQDYYEFISVFFIFSLILRISITIWVVSIAKRQNRESFIWGIFGLFLPSIALIIIGQMNKLYAKFSINNSLSSEENSIILTEMATLFFKEKKYNESIRFSEKAMELDSKNEDAKIIHQKAMLEIPLNDVANKHTQIIFREMNDGKILKIISKKYNSIGAEVYINETPAPDGEYQYKNDDRKLIVKNGKVEANIYLPN